METQTPSTNIVPTNLGVPKRDIALKASSTPAIPSGPLTMDFLGLNALNYKGKPVRWLIREGQPMWVAVDVCQVLELKNTTRALARVAEDEKDTLTSSKGIALDGRAQSICLVTESGLYSLILSSRKPGARAVQRWVTHEVLPAIRKTGGYQVRPRTFREAATEALRLAGDEVLALEHQVEAQRPKVEFYDLLVRHSVRFDLAQCARFINAPGVTRHTLFTFLSQEGVLLQNDYGDYELDSEYIEQDFFAHENAFYYRDGVRVPYRKLVATIAGLDYLKKLVARLDGSGIFDNPLSFPSPTESK
jgi:anti-repressor protein